ALFVPLLFFGQQMSATRMGIPVNYQAVIPSAVIYGMMAVVMVWLGIGSVMARRWARTLMLIFSGSWLVMGLFSVVMMAILVPQLMDGLREQQPGIPGAAEMVVIGIMLLVTGVIFIVLPGVWSLFYRSPHVKATCEARDPAERWTDRCPAPVLTISIWLLLGVPMMLSVPVAYHGVMPFFGVFLTGLKGTLVYLLLAGVWTYAAWAVYRLDPKGWWVTLISFTLFGASAAVTYSQHGLDEMYVLMGFPEQQVEQLRHFGALSRQTMIVWSLWLEALLVVSLLYVRKYFFRGDSQ
ncbi:MAG TPA: hypothetical protein VMB21_10995, partial [Candidatus Limnocylindria bacterium]|nr:hypothetical protein [Candidatus Limnocylindria bacterium]